MSSSEMQEKGLSVMKRQTTIATQQAMEIVVKTDEDYSKASELLAKIKQVQKAVKNEAGKIIEPLRESKRQAQAAMDAENDRWEPILNDVDGAEKVVKKKMVDFVDKKEKIVMAKEEKIQRELETGKIDMEKASEKIDKIVQVPTTVHTRAGDSQVRKVRVVYVVDEKLIPNEYWELNMVRVRKDVLAGAVVPGTEVREENTISGSAY